MKKIFLIAAAALIGFAACNKDDGGNKTKSFDATFELTSELGDLTYGEPVTVTGTVVTEASVDAVSFTGVDDEGNAVGEEQKYENGSEASVSSTAIEGMFFPDTKDMTQLQVTLWSGNATASFTFPVTSVTGEMKGDVYINNSAAFTADVMEPNHQNSPELYPEENTGAGSDVKSFFSMPGVVIDGQVEHILSLNQLRSVDGQNASFVFCNVWKSTDKKVLIGSQRGYAFQIANNLGSGTMGRQCDAYEVDGHAIRPENADANFLMDLVRGSWYTDYDAEKFTDIDRIFINIKDAETPFEKMKAFWQLGEIQRKYDNSTLGEIDPDKLKSFEGQKYLRHYNDAGHSATKEMRENFRAGDYIVIKTTRGTVENPEYYYGIMQIRLIPDVSGVIVDGRFDKELTENLFGQSIYLDIKTQCEILD